MKRLAALLTFAILMVPFLANAQGKKVKVKVEIEVDIEDVTALSEVPNSLDEARESGSTESEIHTGYGAMKTVYIKGKPSLKIADHFRSWAEEGYSDEGLGDLIRECVDKGYKDEALVKCIVGKTKKKKRVHPKGKAIPKGQVVPPTVATTPVSIKKPPPKKLEKEADHVSKPTGAYKGKKLGGKKIKK